MIAGTDRVLHVVAAIIEHQGRILLAKRDEQRDQAGLWEFPGGKVEAGESQPQALIRELREELSIAAHIGRFIACEQAVINNRTILLHAWHVPSFTGTLTLHCHSDLRWVDPKAAGSYALAKADIPLLQAFITSM